MSGPNASMDAIRDTDTETPEHGVGFAHANSFADGTEFADGLHTYTTSADVDAFALNIEFRDGLYHVNSDGVQMYNSIIIRYRYALTGEAFPAAYEEVELRNNKASVLRYRIEQTNLTLGTYDIEVSISPRQSEDADRSKYKPTLASVTEIQNSTDTPSCPL